MFAYVHDLPGGVRTVTGQFDHTPIRHRSDRHIGVRTGVSPQGGWQNSSVFVSTAGVPVATHYTSPRTRRLGASV